MIPILSVSFPFLGHAFELSFKMASKSKREKRQRKVAFADDVDIPDKKIKETDLPDRVEERSESRDVVH